MKLLAAPLLAALCVSLVACGSDKTDGAPDVARTTSETAIAFGSDGLSIARKLGVCADPTPKAGGAANCQFGQDAILIIGVNSEAERSRAVTVQASQGGCMLIGRGFTLAAPNGGMLSAHVNEAKLRARYGKVDKVGLDCPHS